MTTEAGTIVYGSTTVDKAIDVLMLVGEARDGLTNAELSERLGLDRSTTHRLVSTLERRGLVQRIASRRYALGNELYFLAFGGSLDHLVVLRTQLAELVALTGESASFSILHGDKYYCAMQHSSPHDLSYCPTQGEQYPLNAGATGTALLAFQPKARLDDVLKRLELTAFTERTITDPDQLREELARTRERGYAMSSGARTPGGCAIASPALSRNGSVIGAVVLSAVETRTPLEQLVRFEPELKRAATAIGKALEAAR
jgi:DNA-binding IclR family transcriptional regulator